ncbi:hypothetical protein LTR54_004420 [Friedmanniomyces endolithicus]|uniref:Peptidase A1 domain-containing protein n=1 Tax=Friedmanniomyces endolithicus TaxID=329885 RepID=A0AAN6FSI6_9PEZI|nr:hypothetical protein LTS00_011247 [Friedmanniomyces endolithicus]KAK0323349.1 hypothetical protein LTR82_005709 [Friedmanniomyces endolithicus]KAK1013513.1 hypothetical protein LTR54_004420 [Friedmanniomyces endolithicus]
MPSIQDFVVGGCLLINLTRIARAAPNSSALPLSIPPSGYWTIIPQGCTVANPNLTDCDNARGNLFRSNLSSTWSTERLANGGLFQLNTFEEVKLGLTGNAYYGFDSSPPVFGSLTLGGYDASRFTPSNVSFPFGSDFSRDLLVSLESITYDTLSSSPLLGDRIDVFIDSLVTEIWLPISTCQAFETAFFLVWDDAAQLYPVNETLHKNLLAQNPVFTFTLGQAGGEGNDTVAISLPYATFDLFITQPAVNSISRYFPLKQAQNSTQYTLGRTFLQEAYIIADYDRHNFSVSQALFPPNQSPQQLVAIRSPSDDARERHRGLGAGAIAGIVIAAIAILALCIAGIFRLRRRSGRTGQLSVPSADEKAQEAMQPLAPAKYEVSGEAGRHELDADYARKPELGAGGAINELLAVPEHKVHEMGLPEVPVELEAPIR